MSDLEGIARARGRVVGIDMTSERAALYIRCDCEAISRIESPEGGECWRCKAPVPLSPAQRRGLLAMNEVPA